MAGAALCSVNLHVQISWQAQHFVNLHAQIPCSVRGSGCCVVAGCRRWSPVRPSIVIIVIRGSLFLDVQMSLQAQHFVNLHVQISWQAQHFVNLHVQISWQAQRFVNLHVQISWQAQQFVNLHVQISWQAQHFVNLHVQISWQAQHFVKPPCADFVAGTALVVAVHTCLHNTSYISRAHYSLTPLPPLCCVILI